MDKFGNRSSSVLGLVYYEWRIPDPAQLYGVSWACGSVDGSMLLSHSLGASFEGSVATLHDKIRNAMVLGRIS